MNIIDLAKKIAIEAHQGQFRRNGEPYINHPITVNKIVSDWLNDWKANDLDPLLSNFISKAIYDSGLAIEDFSEIVKAVALMHDSAESDSAHYFTIKQFLDFRHDDLWRAVIAAIEALTRKENQDYFDYFMEMRKNPVARLVKLSDLTHNLSDAKPGSQKDKYLFAKYILLNV